MAKRLNMRERYKHMTRLGWDTTYQPMEKVFPYDRYEGIKIKNWDGWEDPFRMTMDDYWKYQGEKEKKLYAIMDAFAQNNGHLNITDANYINALKLFIQGVSPLEYAAHRGFAFTGRHFSGEGARVACQMQALDELRHSQTQIHTVSHYNKHFNGLHDFAYWHDRVWYLSVPKSFFDDARSAGPFEFMVAIGFSFEYVLTNLLFVPFMSGAAYNGDMSTVTFGFSAQSDEARHMTLGLQIIKFILEQHEDNVPIVQQWIDKWLWRGYKVLGLVGMMMDYMLPESPMSWKEAWEIYFEENGGALFNDLARYGITMPDYVDICAREKGHVSHQVWSIFYNHTAAAAFHTTVPDQKKMAWLSEKYPDTFDQYYRPRYEFWRQREQEGKRYYSKTLPMLCQTCQIPMGYTESDDFTQIAYRRSDYRGERYNFCSDPCKVIFDREPEKYIQSWMPVMQIHQGNCGGEGIENVLKWYQFNNGKDNMDYRGSPDHKRWQEMKGRPDASDEDQAAKSAHGAR